MRATFISCEAFIPAMLARFLILGRASGSHLFLLNPGPLGEVASLNCQVYDAWCASCTVEARRLGVHRDRQRAAARASVRRRRQPRGWGWWRPPGGRTRENRKFIQTPSPEICSETISGGEECSRGRGGLFWATSLEKNYRRRDRDHLVPPWWMDAAVYRAEVCYPFGGKHGRH